MNEKSSTLSTMKAGQKIMDTLTRDWPMTHSQTSLASTPRHEEEKKEKKTDLMNEDEDEKKNTKRKKKSK